MIRPAFMRLFDLTMTYKLDSDIPYTYIFERYQKTLKQTPAKRNNLINALVSSSLNQSGRMQYLNELMKHLEVDSFGKMCNNKKLEDKWGLTKEKIISKYKFTIAFENLISKDYVTEKFFQPIAAGSVPIYLGHQILMILLLVKNVL